MIRKAVPALIALVLVATAAGATTFTVSSSIADGQTLTGKLRWTATTTPVASEIACVGPAEFEAVTATRILCPTSAPLSRRLDDVAPEIAAQPLPAESQRSQPYA